MKRGDVYLWYRNANGEEREIKILCRVIQYDDFEVFMDSERLENVYNGWEMDKLRRTESFTRSSKKIFLFNCEFCSNEPYEQKFVDFYHLELPMRIARFREINWGDELFSDREKLRIYIDNHPNKVQSQKTLQCKEIYLSKGGAIKHELIESDNGIFFTVDELLYKANIMVTSRKRNIRSKMEGVGLYRRGTYKGVPWYFYWGYYDLAKILKEHEEEGVDISNA